MLVVLDLRVDEGLVEEGVARELVARWVWICAGGGGAGLGSFGLGTLVWGVGAACRLWLACWLLALG